MSVEMVTVIVLGILLVLDELNDILDNYLSHKDKHSK